MNIHRSRDRHFPAYGLCALLLYAASTSAVMAASFELPPLAASTTAEHHAGKVIWADLVTPDLARAKRFYSGLFDWSFRDIRAGDSDYAVAIVDGRPVGGLLQPNVPPGEHWQPAWLTFIAVSDVDAAKQIALAHGAKLVFDSQNFPNRGRQAVFADPDGAVFAVLASSGGDRPDVRAVPGEWIWSSLFVSNPDTEAAFYQTLFGYEVYDLASDDGSEHVILSSDDYARAGLNGLPSDSARRHPHWLNFVCVTDVTAATAKAVALGGRVLVEPRADRHGGMLAVIADPGGAPIGLMDWPADDSKREPK